MRRDGVGALEMQTSPTSYVVQFLPIFMTAPLFGFVCGYLLHAAVG